VRWTRFQSKAKERAGGQIRRLRSFGVAFQHYCIAWRLGKEVTDALSLGVRSIPTRNYACELVMNGSHPLDISLGSKEIQDRRYNLLRRSALLSYFSLSIIICAQEELQTINDFVTITMHHITSHLYVPLRTQAFLRNDQHLTASLNFSRANYLDAQSAPHATGLFRMNCFMSTRLQSSSATTLKGSYISSHLTMPF
jgi:hypothetical protein